METDVDRAVIIEENPKGISIKEEFEDEEVEMNEGENCLSEERLIFDSSSFDIKEESLEESENCFSEERLIFDSSSFDIKEESLERIGNGILIKEEIDLGYYLPNIKTDLYLNDDGQSRRVSVRKKKKSVLLDKNVYHLEEDWHSDDQTSSKSLKPKRSSENASISKLGARLFRRKQKVYEEEKVKQLKNLGYIVKEEDKTCETNRPFKCRYCNYRAVQFATMKQHEMRHRGERPYKCTQCSYRSTTLGHLNRHIMSHTGHRPHRCPLCPYRAISVSRILRHMDVHGGIPIDYDYKGPKISCQFCPFATVHMEGLERHMFKHSKEKYYKCCHCNKSFFCKIYLRRHVRKEHSGILLEKFQCDYCEFKSSKKNSIIAHIKQKHSLI